MEGVTGPGGSEGCSLPRSSIMFPDPHLNSPIVPEARDCVFILAGYSHLIQSKNMKVRLVSSHPRFSRVAGKLSEVLSLAQLEADEMLQGKKPQQIYGTIFQMDPTSDSKSLNRYRDAYKIARGVERRQTHDLVGVLSEWYKGAPSLLECMLEKVDRLLGSQPSKDESALMWRWAVTNAVVEHMRLTKKNRKRADPIQTYMLRTIWVDFFEIEEFCCVIDRKSGVWSLLSTEEMLMFTDTLISRFNTAKYLRLSHAENKNAQLPNVESVMGLYELVDGWFRTLGGLTYTIIKFLEPLCVGLTLMDSPLIDQRSHFLTEQACSLVDKLADTGMSRAEAVMYMQSFLGALAQAAPGPNHASELHGCFRHWGHNTIIIEEAVVAIKKHAQQVKILKLDTMTRIHCTWTMLLIRHHYQTHSRSWPYVEIDRVLAPNLCHHRKMSTFPTDEQSLGHIYEWAHVRPGVLYSLDSIEDPRVFVKDKSVAPDRPFWDCAFDSVLLGYQPPFYTKSRRLADRFVTDDEFSPYELIRFVESGEIYSDESFNINLSMKERELSAGRPFGKLTYKARQCQALGEYLLAEGPGKAFDSNTMCHTELQLMKEMASQSHVQTTSEEQVPSQGESCGATMVTDYSKFCANFRHETCRSVSKQCAELFGLSDFFSWQHQRIASSMIYVADYHHPPTGNNSSTREHPREDETVWYNHTGGIEGYQQKLWTMYCCALLHLAAMETGVKYSAMIQGDNQIITGIITATGRETRLELRERAVREVKSLGHRMMVLAKQIGLTLKPEETFVAGSCTMYSKRLLLHGSDLTGALKIICRSMPNSSAVFDDPDAQASSISSCGSRSVGRGIGVLASYLLAEFHVSLALRLTELYHLGLPEGLARGSGVEPLTEYEMYLLCNIGTGIGGSSANSLMRYLVRHEPDPITGAIHWLYLKGKLDPNHLRTLTKIIQSVTPSRDILSLIKDPHSVSLPTCRTVASLVKSAVKDGLRDMAKNPVLKGLFHDDCDKDDLALTVFLLSTTPCIPVFSSELYQNSVCGVRDKLTGFVDSSKTTLASALTRGYSGGMQVNIVRVLVLRHQFQVSLVRDLPEKVSPLVLKCSLDVAHFLREKSWGEALKHIGAGELKGDSHPTVFEQFSLYDAGGVGCEACERGDNTYLDLRVVESRHPGPLRYKRGRIVPYVGSNTSEKLAPPILRMEMMSGPLKSCIRTASILGWVCEENPRTKIAIDWAVQQRASIDMSDLKLLTPASTSSNVYHRLHDSFGKNNFTSNRPLNFGSQIHLSTNTLGIFSGDGGGVDGNMIFQNVKHMSISLLDMALGDKEDVKDVNYHLHGLGCCVREMGADFVSSFNCDPPDINLAKGNPLIYDPSPLTGPNLERIRMVGSQGTSRDILRSGVADRDMSARQALGQTLLTKLHTNISRVAARGNAPVVEEDGVGNISEMCYLGPVEVMREVGLQLVSETFQHSLRDLMEQGYTLAESYRAFLASLHVGCFQGFHNMLAVKAIREPLKEFALRHGFVYSRDWAPFHGFGEIIRATLFYTVEDALRNPAEMVACAANRNVFRTDKYFDWEAYTLTVWAAMRDLSCPSPVMTIREWVELLKRTQETPTHRGLSGRAAVVLVLGEMLEASNGWTMEKLVSVRRLMEGTRVSVWECDPSAWAREAVRQEKYGRVPENPDRASRRACQDVRLKVNQGVLGEVMQKMSAIGDAGVVRVRAGILRRSREQVPGRVTHKKLGQSYREIFSARLTGIASSAHYKFIELLRLVDHESLKTCLCVAEGAGGFARVLCELPLTQKVYYSTLIDWSRTTEHYTAADMGSELRVNADGDLHTKIVSLVRFLNDLRDLRTIQFLEERCHSVEIVTCDAEMFFKDLSYDMNLYKNVLCLAGSVLVPSGVFILKVFSDDEPVMQFSLSACCAMFHDVRFVKPMFSSPDSAEVYVIAQNKRPEAHQICDMIRDSLGSTYFPLMHQDTREVAADCLSSLKELRIPKPWQDRSGVKSLTSAFIRCGWPSNRDQVLCSMGIDPKGWDDCAGGYSLISAGIQTMTACLVAQPERPVADCRGNKHLLGSLQRGLTAVLTGFLCSDHLVCSNGYVRREDLLRYLPLSVGDTGEVAQVRRKCTDGLAYITMTSVVKSGILKMVQKLVGSLSN
ncbi:L protein [Fiwi virus]|uniref:RNA-directed RNA polymerase L n=1 Tax=Fiwi virus TaxID=2675848 RepID=A0AAE6PR04_9MONO|nr:L protein [Fiwi virus]QGM12359.2 L protein [Fiwi virus]